MRRIRKHKKKIITAVVATAAVATIAITHIGGRVGPENLYPDPKLSPGLIATSDFQELTQRLSCGTYSQCHRMTTNAQKDEVRSEYPSCPTGPGESEIDHIVPLALGGADDVKNLWCEPADNEWNGVNYGFHTKDALEAFLAEQVKGGSISPTDAQNCILNDWVSCYQRYLGNKLGAIGVQDPDQ